MTKILTKLPEFEGFGVDYDEASHPFFAVTLVECLRLIRSVDLGRELLKLIADAKPKARSHHTGFTIPTGINVLARPVDQAEGRTYGYVQSGHKLDYAAGSTKKVLQKSSEKKHQAPDGCRFYIMGGSFNAAADPSATESGTGSACFMYFTNTQITTTKGERAYPHIVLAHELIHSYHCLYGIKKSGKNEELWTTGIAQFEGERMSENGFRAAFPNMLPRSDYF